MINRILNNIYRGYIKRVFDLIFSSFAIILLSPLLLIIAALVKVKHGSPVIFKQNRPGLNEKIFTLYKFRTMSDKRDDQGNLLSDSERLTNFGKWLRSTSLDELPELWNIFKGEMSFVGPRPLAVEYLDYYTPEERFRHSARPGLTGYAQINGRNSLKWEERFKYDLFYCDNVSLILDIKIFFKTILTVIKRNGIGERDVDGLQDFDKYRLSQ